MSRTHIQEATLVELRRVHRYVEDMIEELIALMEEEEGPLPWTDVTRSGEG